MVMHETPLKKVISHGMIVCVNLKCVYCIISLA